MLSVVASLSTSMSRRSIWDVAEQQAREQVAGENNTAGT